MKLGDAFLETLLSRASDTPRRKPISRKWGEYRQTCTTYRRFILAWVSGLIWSEVKQLWDVGLEEYVNDMWNVIDFVTNSLYVATAALRVVAYYRVQKETQKSGSMIELQREQWDTWDPMLISEGLFSAANIFRSSLNLISSSYFFLQKHLLELSLKFARSSQSQIFNE